MGRPTKHEIHKHIAHDPHSGGPCLRAAENFDTYPRSAAEGIAAARKPRQQHDPLQRRCHTRHAATRVRTDAGWHRTAVPPSRRGGLDRAERPVERSTHADATARHATGPPADGPGPGAAVQALYPPPARRGPRTGPPAVLADGSPSWPITPSPRDDTTAARQHNTEGEPDSFPAGHRPPRAKASYL